MKLREQKKVVARLAALSMRRSDEIREHRIAIDAWKRERLASPGSLALFFAAGFMWGSSGDSRQSPASATVARKAAGAANTSLLLWRLFNDPIQGGS